MTAQKIRMLFLNFGHFADHLFMLIFAKAALSAGLAFGLAADGAYAEMIPYGVPSLILFGACAPLAAHMADRWSRNGMIVVFFIGIGLAAVATSFATSPLEIAVGLSVLGVFAAIYHPVGITMVIEGGGRVGWRLGINLVGYVHAGEQRPCPLHLPIPRILGRRCPLRGPGDLCIPRHGTADCQRWS